LADHPRIRACFIFIRPRFSSPTDTESLEQAKWNTAAKRISIKGLADLNLFLIYSNQHICASNAMIFDYKIVVARFEQFEFD